MKWETIEVCRGCRAKVQPDTFQEMLNLGVQTFSGIFPNPDDEKDVPIGPLNVIKCGSCGLVQLEHDYPPELLYGDTYGYRSGLNAGMVRHLDDIVECAFGFASIKDGDVVIDIGSNDGTLLGHALSKKNVRAIGIDPLALKFREYYPERTEIVPEFFNAEWAKISLAGKKAKAIFSIAMFYDLPDPTQFAKDVYWALHDEGVWCVEVAYLPSQLKNFAFDGFCQEHLSYYSLKQLIDIAAKAGLYPAKIELNKTNGGSVFVIFQKNIWVDHINLIDVIQPEEITASDEVWEKFRDTIEQTGKSIRLFLENARQRGELVLGYGASTKGNVLLQHFGITPELLPAIAEVNEEKFGKVTPGTKIPIISEKQAREMKPDFFFVLPWHFRDGIVERETMYTLRTGCTFVFPMPEMEFFPSRPSWAYNKQEAN